MNCLEFRRTLLVNPDCRETAFLEHLEQCADCAREAEQAWRFEEKLRRALDAAPMDGLEARILLSQSVAGRPARMRRWSLAASLLLAICLSAWLGLHWPGAGQPMVGLEQLVLTHIRGEPQHLEAHAAVSAETLESLLAPFGAHASDQLGQPRYAGRCHIRRQAGVHMVLSGEQGPVTVLIMPGEHAQQRLVVDAEDFAGVIVPTGYGSLAVVGVPGEPVDITLNKVRQGIFWGDAATSPGRG